MGSRGAGREGGQGPEVPSGGRGRLPWSPSARCGAACGAANGTGGTLSRLVTLRPTEGRPFLGPRRPSAGLGFCEQRPCPQLSSVRRFYSLVTSVPVPNSQGKGASATAPGAAIPRTAVAPQREALGLELARQGSPLLAPLRPAQVRQQLFSRTAPHPVRLRQAPGVSHPPAAPQGWATRALIFTQMTRMLDVLEHFLALYGHTYLRLDGTTKPEARQVLVQRFDASASKCSCSSSPRAAGGGDQPHGGGARSSSMGLDWNPAMDQQCTGTVTVLYCTVLDCTVQYCAVQFSSVFYCTVLFC